MFLIFQEVVKKYGKRVILPFILLVSLIIYFLYSNEKTTNEDIQLISSVPQETKIQEQTEEPLKNESNEKVIVDIKGAVKYPGVYELTVNDRVIDAINQAGGYTKNADSSSINHAQKLQDEMVIYVPKKGEDVSEKLQAIQNQPTTISSSTTTSSTSSSGTSSSASAKVNINTANETELTTLSGIGPSKAKAIISYREENGPFKTIEDIKNVSGIGEKTFEKLKDSITVK